MGDVAIDCRSPRIEQVGNDFRRSGRLRLDNVDLAKAVIGDMVVDVDDRHHAGYAVRIIRVERPEAAQVRTVDEAEQVVIGQLVAPIDQHLVVSRQEIERRRQDAIRHHRHQVHAELLKGPPKRDRRGEPVGVDILMGRCEDQLRPTQHFKRFARGISVELPGRSAH